MRGGLGPCALGEAAAAPGAARTCLRDPAVAVAADGVVREVHLGVQRLSRPRLGARLGLQPGPGAGRAGTRRGGDGTLVPHQESPTLTSAAMACAGGVFGAGWAKALTGILAPSAQGAHVAYPLRGVGDGAAGVCDHVCALWKRLIQLGGRVPHCPIGPGVGQPQCVALLAHDDHCGVPHLGGG